MFPKTARRPRNGRRLRFQVEPNDLVPEGTEDTAVEAHESDDDDGGSGTEGHCKPAFAATEHDCAYRDHGGDGEQLDRNSGGKRTTGKTGGHQTGSPLPSGGKQGKGDRHKAQRHRWQIGSDADRLILDPQRCSQERECEEATPRSRHRASDEVGAETAEQCKQQHPHANGHDRAAEQRSLRLKQDVKARGLRGEDLATELLPVPERIQTRQIHALVINRGRVETAAKHGGRDTREAEDERELDQQPPGSENLDRPKPRRRRGYHAVGDGRGC